MCAVGALAALLILRVLTPVGSIGSTPRDAAQSSNAVSSMPAFDLFWPANRRSVGANTSPWVLHGVSFTPSGQGTFAILSQGRGTEQLVVSQGEGFGEAAQLEDVGPDFAVIRSPSGVLRLYLDDAPADGSAVAARADASGIALPGPLDPRLLEQYGFQAGDIVLSVNGQAVRSIADVRGLASARIPGQSTRVTIRRSGAVIEKVLP